MMGLIKAGGGYEERCRMEVCHVRFCQAESELVGRTEIRMFLSNFNVSCYIDRTEDVLKNTLMIFKLVNFDVILSLIHI